MEKGYVVYQEGEGYINNSQSIGPVPFVFKNKQQAIKEAWEVYSEEMEEDYFDSMIESGEIAVLPFEESYYGKALKAVEDNFDNLKEGFLDHWKELVENNQIYPEESESFDEAFYDFLDHFDL